MDKAKKISLALAGMILIMTITGVALNIAQQLAVDRSKIPDKVEDSREFQRWITNLKNKGIEITADEFRMVDEVEIYNTKWMKVYSIEESGKRNEFETILEQHKDEKKVIFSPSEREFIDYRDIAREGYKKNEVHFYGLKDDKIIDARILDCSLDANCYFDRAYFLDNDVFIITEFSRTIDKDDEDAPVCTLQDYCEYSIKLHIVDLINNSRLIYESKPMELSMEETIPEL